MSLKALSDYTVYSRYSHYIKDATRRETWPEMVDRVFAMHGRRYADQLAKNPTFREDFEFAKEMMLKKRVLGSQRALQFGGPGIEKHHAKIYNCSFTYLDRPRAFQEIMYLLLCGCGVGFSVQFKHVDKLPDIAPLTKNPLIFTPEDSIEGWADCVGVLVSSYFTGDVPFPIFQGAPVKFDYSKIRPQGALIAGQYLAPGPNELALRLEKARAILDGVVANGRARLRPIECYDIIMHVACAVLSGGVRRSATICLFSLADKEMMNAKIGNWKEKYKHRSRSNNSVLLLRDRVTLDDFREIIKSTRQCGEPGFVFADSEDLGVNPCVEIGLYGYDVDTGESGVQFCNLTEINGKYCDTKQKFYDCCRAAATIGTMQAGYTDFDYLTPATKRITDREALLGCSVTGIMDNPDVLLNRAIQREGASIVRKTNERDARYIGINPAARLCAVKPAGTTSAVLGTSSGIHPNHAEKYVRGVQANKNEFPLQTFEAANPLAVETSVWDDSGLTKYISFLCEVPKGAIRRNQLSAVELLEKVKLTQLNWVESGTIRTRCVQPWLKHNVSNTINVLPSEWSEVTEYLFKNRNVFAGVALLSAYGDLDYPQAPFVTILSAADIAKEYGDGAALASGLIVDGLRAFKENLWTALDEALKDPHSGLGDDQLDWVRRACQFSTRYFEGDKVRMSHCLKHVHMLKRWLDLKRDYKDIDWSTVIEERETHVEANTLGAQACSGGACEIR